MELVPDLQLLGRRIMVCGPSNSGKSTLAAALGDKLGLPVVHVDLLRHLPGTNWRQRPDEDFERLHDHAIADDAWVMDGNYSQLFPKRLARATGVVLLDDNRWINLYRYFRRTLFEPHRVGHIGGGKDSIKWEMIRWITWVSPKKVLEYRKVLPMAGLPMVECRSRRELLELYRRWGLTRVKAR